MNQRVNNELAVSTEGLIVTSEDGEWVPDRDRDDDAAATLEVLHSVTRALVRADDAPEVSRLAVSAARDVLDLPKSGIHLAEGQRLVPVAVTEVVVETYGDVPTLGPGDGPAWRVFDAGEPIVVGDHDEYRSVAPEETVAEPGVLAPLGDHGVFLMNTRTERSLTDAELSIALTLAANTKAALDAVRREAELARQNERLETFAGMLSHDLRNPLSMVEGNLELARETGEAQYFDRATDAVDRMDELIEHVLTLARSGESVTSTQWIDLTSVATDAWSECSTDADLSLAFTEGVRIAADPDRLRQLLVNLFQNAIDHGGPEPTITLGLAEDVLFVADDGPGIQAADRERIFEYGVTRDEEGTGLGLRIVEELAEAHGWSTRATESDDGGARIELCGVDTRIGPGGDESD